MSYIIGLYVPVDAFVACKVGDVFRLNCKLNPTGPKRACLTKVLSRFRRMLQVFWGFRDV